MSTLKRQRLLRTTLSWTEKKSLQRQFSSHPSTSDVHCEGALNILAQDLYSLLKEAFYLINVLPTVFSFIKLCYLNHRSQAAFWSAHCGFKQQGWHFSFALCCQAVSTVIFPSAKTAELCGTTGKKKITAVARILEYQNYGYILKC